MKKVDFRLYQNLKLLCIKGHNWQSEEATHRMAENTCKSCIREINIQNTQKTSITQLQQKPIWLKKRQRIWTDISSKVHK